MSVSHLRELLAEMPSSELSVDGAAEYERLQQQLELLAGQEASAVKDFYGGLDRLKPNISFDWLYHADAGWIIELIVWSIYGVLASALAWLIKQYRQGTYDANLFLLFIPRLFLAPLLSVVITAFIASGESGYQVNLQNLPAFLVFAFAMGFNSESLTRLIREIFNNLFFETPASEAKGAEGGGDVEGEEDDAGLGPHAPTLLDEWEAAVEQRADELVEKRVNEEFGSEEVH